MSEESAASECNFVYERMARERESAGREVPRKPLYLTGDRVTDDYIKMQVEASQTAMTRSHRRSFLVPDLSHIFNKRRG
jgi:hypothetical protein